MTGKEIRRRAWALCRGRRGFLVLCGFLVAIPTMAHSLALRLWGPLPPPTTWVVSIIGGVLLYGQMVVSLEQWEEGPKSYRGLGFPWKWPRLLHLALLTAVTSGVTQLFMALPLWMDRLAAAQVEELLADGTPVLAVSTMVISILMVMVTIGYLPLMILWTTVSSPVRWRAVLLPQDPWRVQLREGLRLGSRRLGSIFAFGFWTSLPLIPVAIVLTIAMLIGGLVGSLLLLALVVSVYVVFVPYLYLAQAGFYQQLWEEKPPAPPSPPRPMKLSGSGGGYYWCPLNEGASARPWPPQ